MGIWDLTVKVRRAYFLSFQDSGLNAQIIYTFVNDGGDNDVDNFMIDSTTGAVSFCWS